MQRGGLIWSFKEKLHFVNQQCVHTSFLIIRKNGYGFYGDKLLWASLQEPLLLSKQSITNKDLHYLAGGDKFFFIKLRQLKKRCRLEFTFFDFISVKKTNGMLPTTTTTTIFVPHQLHYFVWLTILRVVVHAAHVAPSKSFKAKVQDQKLRK